MRVVLTGGGTAGHINPALALAEELSRRGDEVFFAGSSQGREAELVPAAGLNFVPFEASGFNRNHPLTLIKALRLLASSTRKAKAWYHDIKPDAVVGFGGYVSLAVGRAALSCSIPLVVHEQNSVMGMANKNLSQRAQAVCLAYAHAGRAVKNKEKIIITGNPVRGQVLEAHRDTAREFFGISQEALVLLITGGSLGARHLNKAVCALRKDLLSFDDLVVFHVTGPKEFDSVCLSLSLTPEEEKRYKLMAYSNDMGQLMAASDLIVSRAGASSLAEISARALPALLVPFPYATEDHQTLNARASVEVGCAYMVSDADVETDLFKSKLTRLLQDKDLREHMSEMARAQKTIDAARKLADVVYKVCDKKLK